MAINMQANANKGAVIPLTAPILCKLLSRCGNRYPLNNVIPFTSLII